MFKMNSWGIALEIWEVQSWVLVGGLVLVTATVSRHLLTTHRRLVRAAYSRGYQWGMEAAIRAEDGRLGGFQVYRPDDGTRPIDHFP